MEINKVVCETPEQFRAECEKWAGKCVIRGRKLIAYGQTVAELVLPRGGYRQGAGRPRGDRTKVVTIRLTEDSVNALNAITDNKSKYIDDMITSSITMSQLAGIINESEDFPVSIVDKVIEANGWQDDRGETWGVCRSDKEVLELNEEGKAVVFPNN